MDFILRARVLPPQGYPTRNNHGGTLNNASHESGSSTLESDAAAPVTLVVKSPRCLSDNGEKLVETRAVYMVGNVNGGRTKRKEVVKRALPIGGRWLSQWLDCSECKDIPYRGILGGSHECEMYLPVGVYLYGRELPRNPEEFYILGRVPEID